MHPPGAMRKYAFTINLKIRTIILIRYYRYIDIPTNLLYFIISRPIACVIYIVSTTRTDTEKRSRRKVYFIIWENVNKIKCMELLHTRKIYRNVFCVFLCGVKMWLPFIRFLHAAPEKAKQYKTIYRKGTRHPTFLLFHEISYYLLLLRCFL